MSKKHSDDQKFAIDQFGEFIESSSQVLIISGSAGTGKTSLIKDFAKISKQKNWNCIPLGVWGRSSSAITQLTNIPSLTVRKYIQINEDIENGKYEEETFIEWYKKHYKKKFDFNLVDKFFGNDEDIVGDVLVVDEASTIDNEELVKFTNYCLDNSDDFKLVFIGDHCQLPPIQQEKSNAFDGQWFEKELNFDVFGKQPTGFLGGIAGNSKFDMLQLTQSHRVSEGPLFELAKKMRPLAENNSSGDEARRIINNSINNSEILGYGRDPCFQELGKRFKDNPSNVIFLAPGNKESFESAQELRKIFYPEVFKTLDKGEYVRVFANGIKENFVTGDEFEIMEVVDDFDKFVVVKAKEITRSEEFTGYNFMQRIADLFNIFDKKEENIVTVAIYKNALTDFSLWSRRGAVPRMRTEIQEAWDQIGWENDDDRTVDDVLICRYAYGSTVHSAQGGEWDTVALLLDGKSKNDTARFWYTAATRAKKELFILRTD